MTRYFFLFFFLDYLRFFAEIDKSVDWFLYDIGLRHERVNSVIKFDMPGDNCAIPGCSTSRATPGVALLGTAKNNDEYNVNWRKNIVDMITKIRVVDASLKRQIERRSLHFCEKHYSEEKLIRCKCKIMTIL